MTASDYGFAFCPGDIVATKVAIGRPIMPFGNGTHVRYIVDTCILSLCSGGVQRSYSLTACTPDGNMIVPAIIVQEHTLIASVPFVLMEDPNDRQR